jgi:hypothetical protein
MKRLLVMSLFGVVLLAGPALFPTLVRADLLGPLITEGADPVGKNNFAFQFISLMFIKSGDYDDQGERKYLPSGDRFYRLTTVFKPIYGLTEAMDINAEIPVATNWASRSGRSAHQAGIGDIVIGTKYRFLEEEAGSLKPSLTGIFKMELPTGRYDYLSPDRLETDKTGNGSYGVFAAAVLGKTFGNWAISINVGYNWLSEVQIEGHPIKPGDTWSFNLAGEWSFSKRWSLIGELKSWYQVKTRENGQDLPCSEAYSIECILALGYKLYEKGFIVAGVSLPLAGRNNDFGYTPGLLVNFYF